MRVFAQRSELSLDLPELLRATRRYFDSTLDVLSQSEHGERVKVRLVSEKHGYAGNFEIAARAISPADLDDARVAEERGRAAGMSSLAERCHSLWEIHVLSEDAELASLNLCGILASVALGPVLPDDGATLYGVRGSMERVERLLKSR